jgi:hypothetical protein
VAENAERRVTPHLAWLTGETLERSRAVIAENCRRLRTGEPLLHRVACTEYSATLLPRPPFCGRNRALVFVAINRSRRLPSLLALR